MKKNGFTLIELIVVLAIIAILLGTGVPSLYSYRQRRIESERANQEYVLNKAVKQYYALTGSYPNPADYIDSSPAGRYWDSVSVESSFLKDIMVKTGIYGDGNTYSILYTNTPQALVTVTHP